MNESNPTLEMLHAEVEAIEAEIKARGKALKKTERKTFAALFTIDHATESHSQLLKVQTEFYNKYAGLIKETVTDLNNIVSHMIAVSLGQAEDQTPDMFEALELKLLDKAKTENDAMLQLHSSNEANSLESMSKAEATALHYYAEQESFEKFVLVAESKIKELKISMERIPAGHE